MNPLTPVHKKAIETFFYAVHEARPGIGEVAEWLKAPLSKSGIPFTRDRGFESHPLRHFLTAVGTVGKGTLYLDGGHCALAFKTERCPSWLKEHDWKSCVSFIAAPRVRIPLSPPPLESNPSIPCTIRSGAL
jgi:hypothetical protein